MINKFIIISAIVSLLIFSPGAVFAQNPPSPCPGPTCFQNPLSITTIDEFITSVLDNLNGVIAMIAIVFIVIGGLMYIFAGGDEGRIKKAKSTITAAVIGFAITISAGTFLKEIADILGYTGTLPAQATGALTIYQIVGNVLEFLLSIIGIIAIIGLVIGGAMYLTAYGDDNQIKKGKSIITSSLIGIAIALAALMIVQLVADLIQGTGQAV